MIRTLFAALILIGPAWAADPPAPPAPWVVPHDPAAPTPSPPPKPVPPAPGSALALPPGVYYVVETPQPSFMMPADASLLAVKELKGPVVIGGVFVDGTTGQFEDRSYPGPQVFVIRSVGSGRSSFTLIKSGAQSPADVFTRAIDAGGAQPPPPPPPPPASDFQAKLQAAFLLDRGTQAQANLLAQVYAGAPVNDQTIKTWGDLVKKLQAVTAIVLPQPVGLSPLLSNTRTFIAGDLKATLGDNGSVPMDAAFRASVTAEFTKIATALSALHQ